MLKRDEVKGPSCLTSAADDEPVFVLRANDELAPALVRDWAMRYAAQKGVMMSDRQWQKLDEASRLARQMEVWRASKRMK